MDGPSSTNRASDENVIAGGAKSQQPSTGPATRSQNPFGSAKPGAFDKEIEFCSPGDGPDGPATAEDAGLDRYSEPAFMRRNALLSLAQSVSGAWTPSQVPPLPADGKRWEHGQEGGVATFRVLSKVPLPRGSVERKASLADSDTSSVGGDGPVLALVDSAPEMDMGMEEEVPAGSHHDAAGGRDGEADARPRKGAGGGPKKPGSGGGAGGDAGDRTGGGGGGRSGLGARKGNR